MNDHPSSAQLRDYVMGSLTGAEADALEVHVASCPECTAALQAEARLEVHLHAVGGAVSRRSRSRWFAVAAVAAAVAATLALTIPRDPAPPRLEVGRWPEPRLPVCVRDPGRCEDAALHGLRSPGDPIPRYEASAPARLSVAPVPPKETP